jgi:transposase
MNDNSSSIIPSSLPADAAILRGMVAELLARLAEATAQLAEANGAAEKLKHELMLLRHWRFGRSSEKTGDNGMDSLFAELTAASLSLEDTTPEAADAVPQESSAKRKGHGRRTLPADLPVERVVVEPAPEEKVCSPCGAEKISIGEEKRHEYDYIPGTIFVRAYIRPIYACPKACEGQVVVAPPPAAPIEKGMPGPGLLAIMAVNKYVDHLPLARQESRLEREGLFISRQTQCDWMRDGAQLLTSFTDLLRQVTMRSKVIHTDETPVKYLEGKQNKPKIGRLWIYHGDRNHPYTFYEFTPTRQRMWPAETLAGWKGHLQADAFPGYDALYAAGDIVEVACWAHARRKFKEAELSGGKRAPPILRRIGELYAIERSIREEAEKNGWSWSAPGEEGDKPEVLRQQRREKEAAPVLATLKRELDALALAVLPKSPMGQATAYTLGNWKALTVYATNGALAIDNNTAERGIRPVTVGRKNYLFFGSLRGGHTAATMYSVLESAKRHGIKPWEYLRDLFRRLPTMKVSDLPDLLPDRWKAARNDEVTKAPL